MYLRKYGYYWTDEYGRCWYSFTPITVQKIGMCLFCDVQIDLDDAALVHRSISGNIYVHERCVMQDKIATQFNDLILRNFQSGDELAAELVESGFSIIEIAFILRGVKDLEDGAGISH